MVHVVFHALISINTEIMPSKGDCVKSSPDRKCFIKRGCDKDKLYHTHDIHYTYEIKSWVPYIPWVVHMHDIESL